jgi:uncharacterized protein (DUF58 family)
MAGDPSSTPGRTGRPGFLDAAALARLGSFELRARTIVEGAYAGMHHNLHAGTSIEFTEHKEYAPGDEIRRIDWKAVGRVDRYYVKRFEDETEMRTFLALDGSASMGYGRKGVTKLAFGSYLAAAVSYLLAQQGDPAGLMLFDENTRKYLPPSTRPGHTREIFRLLEAANPLGRTDAARALGALGEIVDKRSLVMLFSDLLDADAESAPASPETPLRNGLLEKLRQMRARGHDVVLFHVLDPDEVELPFDDLTFFEGMEPGDTRTLLARGGDLRAAFKRESAAFRERWRRACLEARIEYRFVITSESPAEVLRAFLAGRQKAAR